MENGRIATSRQVSKNAYVDADGKKCKKEEVRLSVLKKKLQSTLNGYSGSWSVYVKDLKTNDVLSINEVSMYPASVTKLFVMEAVYAGVKEKRISLNANTKNLLSNMIIYSDNESYNQLVRDLGGGSPGAAGEPGHGAVLRSGRRGRGRPGDLSGRGAAA